MQIQDILRNHDSQQEGSMGIMVGYDESKEDLKMECYKNYQFQGIFFLQFSAEEIISCTAIKH